MCVELWKTNILPKEAFLVWLKCMYAFFSVRRAFGTFLLSQPLGDVVEQQKSLDYFALSVALMNLVFPLLSDRTVAIAVCSLSCNF